MKTIYHYCDLNAFLNIIGHRKLWLSAANNLNDYNEVNWFVDKVSSGLSEAVTSENGRFLQEFWGYRREYCPMPFICSFSKEGDLLSQWRAYAGDGSGVAIGFNRECFPFDGKWPATGLPGNGGLGLRDVIYDEPTQMRVVADVRKFVESPTEDEQVRATKYLEAATLINQYSPFCKNPAFQEEQEVRIVHSPMITGNDKGDTNVYGGISSLKHRVSGAGLTSYFDFDFSECGDDMAMVEVVLGPKCKMSKFDIETFLSVNGYGRVPFRRSMASYR